MFCVYMWQNNDNHYQSYVNNINLMCSVGSTMSLLEKLDYVKYVFHLEAEKMF